MAMSNNGRGDAIYDRIALTDNFSRLSDDEKNALRTQLRSIWGQGDLAYIKANAEVLPGTFQDPAGASVSTTGSATAQTGFVTSATAITGKGTVT